MKLHQSSPECVVMFLAGSLPATGILDLRILGHLGMIARLGPGNILHQHGRHILLNPTGTNTRPTPTLAVSTNTFSVEKNDKV